ncbi:MAG TPA: hypothetical protein VJT72_18680 [Pseudonocardiaceae bacterium]|nr:hypothetical protein [Pseudonocardiaceae bacterium]
MLDALNAPSPTGMLPLEPSIVGTAVDAMLVNQRIAEGDRPHAFNRRLRASWAGGCSRRMGFELIGFPPDLETEAKSLRIFDAGDRAHDLLQSAMVSQYDMEIEVPADWWPELDLGCNLDGVYDYNGVTGFEAKSMAPFGFEIATGQRRRDEPPGPKFEHVLQSGLGSLAPTINAEKLHIVYYNKANSDIADWVFGVDEPLPHLEGRTVRSMVADELRRMAGILTRVDNGELPRAVIPGHGVVTNPPAKDSKGQPWNCRYCAFQPTCSRLGPEVITVEHLKTLTQQQNQKESA